MHISAFLLELLNREAASSKNKPQAILEALPLQKGSIVADVGSGGGYFTMNWQSG